MGRIGVWARPGSRVEQIVWDPWRDRWVVHCREPAQGGRANEAILRLLAERLGVPSSSVRYLTGHRSSSKWVEVDGLPDSEITRRLRRVSVPAEP